MKIAKAFATVLFTLTALLAFGAGNSEAADVSESATIWSGPTTTFEKLDGADPTASANQDRLTENVWITRGNNGGEIYNAAMEESSTQGVSPEGTEWAVGTTDGLANLTFEPFRAAVGRPQGVVGKELVLHLIESDIYLDVRFTSWSPRKQGGFSYERSTPGE